MIDAVRDQATFRDLRTQGKRGRSGPVRAMFLPHSRSDVLVAFAIGRKFGPAVHRNRARRRVQAVLRSPDLSIAPGAYLFTCQRDVMTMPFDDLSSDVQRCVAACAAKAGVEA